MSYNIIKESKSLVLLQETAVNLMYIQPTDDIILKHIQVHLFLKGLVGADFKMRLNAYHGDGTLMMQSSPVNNLDIPRTGDFYCELRFDFPQIGNLFSLSKNHRIELEIYDGYNYTSTNFVAIMLGAFGDLAWLGSGYFQPEWAPQLAPRLSIFTDVINPPSQEKFILVRLKCGRLVSALFDPYVAYGAYFMYTAFLEPGLEVTEVYLEQFTNTVTTYNHGQTIIPGLGPYAPLNQRWYYNKVTGVFQFFTDTQIQHGVFVIMEYALHFTNFKGRYHRSTPNTGTISDPKVYWDPRLADNVEVSFTQENNLSGLLSISTSSIQLKNHDRAINNYFSKYDCFNNREVKAWRGIGESFQFLFQGTIRSAAVSDESVEFGVDDMLSVLDQTFEDNGLLTFGNLYGIVLAEDRNRIMPRSFGRLTPWDASFYWFSAYPGVTLQRLYGISGKMPRAACSNYNPALSTTVNRTWSCGYGPGSVTLSTWPVSTHTSVARFGGTASRLLMNMAAIAPGVTDLRQIWAIGDTIKQGLEYGIIADVDADSIYIWPQNAALTTADITRSRVAVVIERGGVQVFPVALRDYTVSIGDFGDLIITFVNGFETTPAVGLASALDPSTDKVYFRAWNDQDTSASKFLYNLLTTFGGALSGQIQVPIGTFTPDQFPSWPDPQLSFTIPFAGSETMPTYRELFEKILRSAMAFVYFDNSGLMRYKSFLDTYTLENQSGVSTNNSLTENNSGKFSVQLDLYDLYSGVNFEWTHNPFFYSDSSVNATYALEAVKALYKTNKKYDVETLVSVQDIFTPNFLYEFVRLVTGRTAIYKLEGFDDHMGCFIGDDILVSRGKIIGGENSQTLRILSLTKGVNGMQLGFTDLKRFPTL